MGFFGGGSKSSETPLPSADGDADFADFAAPADAAEPSPAFTPLGAASLTGEKPAVTAKPYTKWYRVDQRHSINEFWAEGMILASMAVLLILYMLGAGANRSRAKKWLKANGPAMASEFAIVGFHSVAASGDKPTKVDDAAIEQRSPYEFASYATGRANVAFVDIKITLLKRFNLLSAAAETILGFLFESFPSPEDVMEATMYPFDGQESRIVPEVPGSSEVRKLDKSTYDGFVFAIVHKDRMKKVRDDRYDLSITSTRDHPKLPVWLSVMSENAEITDALLTDELIKATEQAGDLFHYLIVTDQPTIKPTTIEETKPNKRIYLKYNLPSGSYDDLQPIFNYFLSLPDLLVKSASFRPAVVQKLKAVRELAVKELKKAAEDEKAEERAAEKDRARKAKRDQELNALDAKAQKKYLEKEKEKEMRKAMKKGTVRA